jgi:hypothetical protein
LTKNSTQDQLEQTIIQITLESKPQTVKELVSFVKQKTQVPEKQIIQSILNLQSQGKLKFTTQPQPTTKISAYLETTQALWYWITLAWTIATIAVVFTIPEDSYPVVYIRQVLGVVFVLWLPGYSFIKALFPKQVPIKTSDKNLDTIERAALSLGMSLALVPIVGLLLNYTPWGIRLTPITLSLTTLTIVFATAGIIREYQTKKT